jgi:ATP-dependent Lon protease
MSDFDWNAPKYDLDRDDLHTKVNELGQIPEFAPDSEGLIRCIVLPLRDQVIFPHMVAPLPIGRQSTIESIKKAGEKGSIMIAVPQMDPRLEIIDMSDLNSFGVSIAVSDVIFEDVQKPFVLVQGRKRVSIIKFETENGLIYADAQVIEEEDSISPAEDARIRKLISLFETFTELDPTVSDDILMYVKDNYNPGWLADMVANVASFQYRDTLELLVETDAEKRLDMVSKLLSREIEIIRVNKNIDDQVQTEYNRSHRENYLREQMRAIQRELGEDDPWTQDLKGIYKRIKLAKLPEEIEAIAMKELERLYQIPQMAPEVGVIRTYLDWILDLPWHTKTDDDLDVNKAAEILDKNHYGLAKAKDRILEYIAVKSLKPENKRQPILCFVGPPGTGKTTLGRSIAEALGRKFMRQSLGGVRDESEMRGHRRTYIGALPGRIIQTMKRAEVINPLFVLDEIDKLGIGYRGDPAAALLEVLDPELNDTFSDHYLEVPYDLSNVMFITTANTQADIPWALLDRMEVVEFPGYIEEDKIQIAKKFLIKKQIEESGLEENEIAFSEQAIRAIISKYTYEAGVRNLDREIGRACRKVARLKAEGKKYPRKLSPAHVERYLGPASFNDSQIEKEAEIGVATGVAWTENGGDIMPIEVVLVDGKGNLQITGQIGDVMQESAHAGMTFMRSRAKELGLEDLNFEEIDVHIHVPEGAVPKDGPSAGITITAALISAFTKRKIKHDLGMTGEITLRGKILPVGGVRNKILAAHRAGVKTILMPEKSKKDLVDVPKKALADLEIITVNHMDEVLELIFADEVKQKAIPVKSKKSKDKNFIRPGV